MKNEAVKYLVSGLLALTAVSMLSGCGSSHSGPPTKAVKEAYIKFLFFHDVSTHYMLSTSLFKKLWKVHDGLVVQSCKPASEPSMWTCLVYQKGRGSAKGRPVDRDFITLEHADHEWTLNRSMSREAY
jgi:hypothetical protein